MEQLGAEGASWFLADSVHSVGVVSELTTLQTVQPQEAPEAQAAAPEPQFQPDQPLGQAPNVPYLPQCKFCPTRSSIQSTISSFLISGPFTC